MSLALANPAHWAHPPAMFFGKGHPQLVAAPSLGAHPSLSLAEILGLGLPHSKPVEAALLVTEEP